MIFILGGAGFVGSAYTRWCRERSMRHAVITRSNYTDFVGQSCDILINAAGSSSKVMANSDPIRDIELSTVAVRKSLVDFKYDRYVHISSCDVYPNCSSLAGTREDCELDVSAQSHYGFHRFLAEQCVRHESKYWLMIRQGGLVGPGLRKNAIYDILYGSRLWLDPASELQFINSDVAAALVMTLVERRASREVFNVCGDGTIGLEAVMKLAGRRPELVSGAERSVYNVSIDKLKREVPVPPTRTAVSEFVKASQLLAKNGALQS